MNSLMEAFYYENNILILVKLQHVASWLHHHQAYKM